MAAKKKSSKSTVVVEGTVTPCVRYPRGEQRVVEYDEHVQRLINGGFLAVVPDDDNDDEPQFTESGGDVQQQQADLAESNG